MIAYLTAAYRIYRRTVYPANVITIGNSQKKHPFIEK